MPKQIGTLKSTIKGKGYTLEFNLEDLYAALETTSQEIAEEFKDAAVAAAPVKTGALRDSIHIEGNEGFQKDIVVDVPYASYTNWREGISCSHWFDNCIYRTANAIRSKFK